LARTRSVSSPARPVLVAAAGHAFLPAFLIAGALALLGALFLAVRMRWSAGLAAAAALAVAAPAGYAYAHRQLAQRPGCAAAAAAVGALRANQLGGDRQRSRVDADRRHVRCA